jgi:hypothetical protein
MEDPAPEGMVSLSALPPQLALMTTPTEYRDFALECLKWAEETSSASQRKAFVDLARLWMEAAFRLDQGGGAAPDQFEHFREARAKLD